ncbi:MAG: hypothetical protein PHY30_01080 [Candidatus Pacebacteria bacterium]|nr:hypothetical protein [Candidatus Paceibacterota bacterium]
MPLLKNKKPISFIIVGTLILIFIGSIAFAEGGIVPCGRSSDDPTTAIDESAPCQINHVFILINDVMAVMFPIINAIAILLIVWAGINIIWAQGDEKKVKTGKDIITAVAFGILIIYGAKFLITSFVDGFGLDKKFLNPLNNVKVEVPADEE